MKVISGMQSRSSLLLDGSSCRIRGAAVSAAAAARAKDDATLRFAEHTLGAEAAGYDSAVRCVQAVTGRRVDEEIEVGPCAMLVVADSRADSAGRAYQNHRPAADLHKGEEYKPH